MSMIAVFIGRLFIALIFVVSGINKLIHVTDTHAMISAAGLPGWLAVPTGLFELIAGVCIALGIYARAFSLLLAAFVLLTILFFHRDFTDPVQARSEEHTSELQSLMRISYAVFCFKKKKTSTHI